MPSSRTGVSGFQPSDTTVLLVGAGILNLITAEYLAVRGFRVRLVDAGPDPRFCKDWTTLGITNGGGNARMFTYTEADNYNEKGSKLYQNMQSIFRRTAREGGWSVKSPEEFTASELAWIHVFEQLPASLAQAYREDMFAVNRDAGELWKYLQQSAPQLFEGVEYHKDILRLYVEPEALEAAIKLHEDLGIMLESSSLEEFLTTNPAFHPAAEADHLAGGITVEGFTVNVHSFVTKLLLRIVDHGGEFVWNCQVQAINRNTLGEVTSLKSEEGRLEADHFVLSPGVTGNALLHGTASENVIQGILGVWLQIPNLHPQLQHSIKIHRRGHLVEDINVTVAKDVNTGEAILHFGGGYGYVGLDRPRPDDPELLAIFNELQEVARIYFPRGYAAAKERGDMFPSGVQKFCIRPFTPTGLGVFEQISTADGGRLIITGGNNTGGFAQAPAIARAVWRALVGEHDPVHTYFHPARSQLPKTTVTFKSRTLEPQTPLKLLLLCSDSPQHDYLRYRLDQAFPDYRCIIEPGDGQLRHLVNKNRMVDAYYMQYHSLRRRLFGYDQQRKDYFKRLTPQSHTFRTPDLTVDSLNCREVWTAVDQWRPELTIVCGTKYIGKKLNDRAGLMINLHTGHLPNYKGNHCIFFALYDGQVDKVSATLHELTPELDGGHVLDRIFPQILASDSEDTLYSRCIHMAIDRCIEHAKHFAAGKKLEFIQQEMAGKTFKHSDRTPGKELWLWWQIWKGLLGGQRDVKTPQGY
ncbi:nucleotide-binding domain-containing protein [Myriangium duriaei CBS 260.36]|uniref:Nucleotide-binding domain-containing protein n=1 Tax=Myriangium duriaei CBS 260.36 TaxID=1168546 RepID=A0A9P4J123_9PEZI|nr:nucleotide-binding domain-containing protein [Myriangium duriaei CBS 260.36]